MCVLPFTKVMDRARLHRLERGETSGDLEYGDVTMDSDEDTVPIPAPARGRGRGGRARGGRGRGRGLLAKAKLTKLQNNLGINVVVSVRKCISCLTTVCYAYAHGSNQNCVTDFVQ